MPVPLLKRFPRLRPQSDSWPVIKDDRRADYPALTEDFAQLDEVVAPAFARWDKAAMRDQNAYRRQGVLVLIGSAAVTALGGIQALAPGQRWPGLVLAAAGILLATSSQWARERDSLDSYLQARLKAERLRALHFRYLARAGSFADDGREHALAVAVLAIERGKEPK
jgi:hypothetical protein